MSVITYTPEELQEILDSYNFHFEGEGPSVCQVHEALESAFIANRAAWTHTYSRGWRHEMQLSYKPTLTACKKQDGWTKQVLSRHIASLLYNTVSNSGRCFLPKEDRRILENVKLLFS